MCDTRQSVPSQRHTANELQQGTEKELQARSQYDLLVASVDQVLQ